MSHLGKSAAIYSITVGVADQNSGSGALLSLDPGSGIGFFQISDPKPISLIKFGKKYYNSSCFS
jgi:hypothetical protein